MEVKKRHLKLVKPRKHEKCAQPDTFNVPAALEEINKSLREKALKRILKCAKKLKW